MEDVDPLRQERAEGGHHRGRAQLRLRLRRGAGAAGSEGAPGWARSSPAASPASSTGTPSTSGCRSSSVPRPMTLPDRGVHGQHRPERHHGERDAPGRAIRFDPMPEFLRDILKSGGLVPLHDGKTVPADRERSCTMFALGAPSLRDAQRSTQVKYAKKTDGQLANRWLIPHDAKGL